MLKGLVLSILLSPLSRLGKTVSTSEDDFALHGDVMETGAFELRMVFLTVVALDIVVSVG
jgi:hypothetical protein